MKTQLGPWGFTFRDTYRDLVIDLLDRSLHLFVAAHKSDAARHSKSWYVLKHKGFRLYWYLLRREDRWGTFRNSTQSGSAYRRVPLLDRPVDISQRAWELRDEFKPYQIIDWYGKRREVMSYPCPERNGISIMLRTPDDPTTLQEYLLEEYIEAEVLRG